MRRDQGIRIGDRDAATGRPRWLRWLSSSKLLGRLLKYGISVVILALSFWYVGQKVVEGAADVLTLAQTVDYTLLSLSIGLTVVCTVLGGWEWNLLLTGLGVRLPLRQALKVHLLSIIPKYAPGLPWQLVGKAYLCGRAGVPRPAIVVSMAGELAIIVLAGISVLLLTLPATSLPPDTTFLAPLSGAGAPALAIGYSLIVPLVARILLQSRMARRALGVAAIPSYSRLLFVFVAVALTWIVFGVTLFLLVAAVLPVPVSLAPSLIFALTASFIVSLLAFFVPLGLGVREGMLVFLLSLWLPAPVAALAAVMSRLVLAVGESIAFALALRL